MDDDICLYYFTVISYQYFRMFTGQCIFPNPFLAGNVPTHDVLLSFCRDEKYLSLKQVNSLLGNGLAVICEGNRLSVIANFMVNLLF